MSADVLHVTDDWFDQRAPDDAASQLAAARLIVSTSASITRRLADQHAEYSHRVITIAPGAADVPAPPPTHVDLAVVIPAYNASRHIAATLDSVLADRESGSIEMDIVVVDDGSTDDTGRVAERYADRGVRLFRQPNLDCGVARNTGMALTDSDWVAHFDADDLWPLGRAAALLGAAGDDAEVDAVFGSVVEFADDAPENVQVVVEPRQVPVATIGVIRRRVFDTRGGFPLSSRFETLDWSGRAVASGLRYRTIDMVVTRRRIHRTNKSHGRTAAVDKEQLATLRRIHRARQASPRPE